VIDTMSLQNTTSHAREVASSTTNIEE